VEIGGQTANFTVSAPQSAAFTTSNLNVSSDSVASGGSITITVDVTNTGDVEGSRYVELKLNGAVEATQTVPVAGGVTREVSFAVTKRTVGSYSVEVDGQTASFTVTEPLSLPWLLIAELIGGLFVLGLLVYFVWYRYFSWR
jgi:uncharacterized protein YfaS (alpha-2-macroglobulin family)